MGKLRGPLPLRLRTLRAEKGWTQEEAARQIGITRDTLSRLEHGLRQPQAPTVARIARAYGVDTEDLLAMGASRVTIEDEKGDARASEASVTSISDTAEAMLGFMERWYDRQMAEVNDPTSPHFRNATVAALWVARTRDDANDFIGWLADWLQEHREKIESWDDLEEILRLFLASLSLDNPADFGERRLQEMSDSPDEVAARRLQRATAEAEESRERLEIQRRRATGG